MTTVLTFTEEEHQEALDAMKAQYMKVAGFEFDQKLREIIKWSPDLTQDQLDIYEKVRELHRSIWEENNVSFME